VIGETSIELKLSVWRDYVPDKLLVFRPPSGDERQLLTAGSDLQQEVFVWQLNEDPFGGVSEDATRMRLRALLVDRFEPSQPPNKRRFSALREFLSEADAVIEDDKAEWAISQEPPSDDDGYPYRLNPLLALKLYLDWLADSFEGQPGMSLSIR
jgi:hypothetical protein